jgi:hypothetical protein
MVRIPAPFGWNRFAAHNAPLALATAKSETLHMGSLCFRQEAH